MLGRLGWSMAIMAKMIDDVCVVESQRIVLLREGLSRPRRRAAGVWAIGEVLSVEASGQGRVAS